jgi:ribulose bisphosphate carboxylase small subunit
MKHTIEELKQMLIDKTAEYVKLESYDNKEARLVRYDIDLLIKSIQYSK